MADKDVKLIIRAKNEASRAIDAVSEALAELNKNQKTVGNTASNTDGLLGTLGDEFQRLSREANGLGALNKVAGQLDRVNAAISRIQGETSAAADDLARFTADTQKAANATRQLQTQVGGLESALMDQQKATDAARDARTRANRELRKAETAYARLQAQIEKQDRRGSAARSADAFVAADVENARQAAVSAAAAYDQQRAKQDSAKKSLADLNGEIVRSEANQARLTKEVEDATAATERNNQALDKAKTQLAEIQTIGKTAAAALGNVAVSQNEVAEASARVNSDLARVRAQYEAMQRFSDGAGGSTDPKTAQAIRNQRAEIEKTRAAWKTLEDEARRLGTALSQTAAPTQQQVAALQQVVSAARAAKAEFTQLQAGLARLQGSARGSLTALSQVDGGLKRVAATANNTGRSVEETGRRMRGVGSGLRGIFEPFYGESRQAMSVLQRLRGELLSLTTAYFGLYGAISNVGGVISAYQSLEAAQNRLGAVFNQDQSKTATELAWLERQAGRLGIAFGTLASQYGKFAVAADASNFTSEATRKVFLSVAEAGRVNKLSIEEVSGVFLALEQMVSKGKITAEELRGQLGERLPGAMVIMADALGYTTAELDAMMKKGELLANQDTLLKFAAELDKRFGPQLATSLRSTTTLIGKFQNELYQAQLRVANGGFIDGLNKALESLNAWFQSREGRDFFLSLGAALGRFVEALAEVPQYFGLIGDAIQLIVALKLGLWAAQLAGSLAAVRVQALAMVGSFAQAQGQLVSFGAAKDALRARITALQGSLVALRTSLMALPVTLYGAAQGLTAARVGTIAWTGALAGLRAAVIGVTTIARGLFLALGGWVGIAVTALSFLATDLLAGWVGGVDEATTALDEHQRIMAEVIGAYEEVKGKTDDWAQSIKNVSKDQASLNFRRMAEEYQKALGEFGKGTTAKFDRLEGPALNLFNLRNSVREGKLTVQEFIDQVGKLYETLEDDNVKRFAEELLDAARTLLPVEERAGQAALAVKEVGVESEQADSVLEKLGTTMESVSEAAKGSEEAFYDAAAGLESYTEAVDKLKEAIPELADELKKLKDLEAIDAAYNDAINKARTIGQVLEAGRLRDLARQGINDKYTNYEAQYTSSRGTAQGAQLETLVREVSMLAQQMGLSAKDLLTVMSFETGGTLNPGIVGGAGGNYQGLIQFGPAARQRYGVSADSSIPDQVRATGKYLADAGVKAGDGLLQIYAAINAGSAKKIHASDANNGGTPGTVLDKVTGQMSGHKARADALLATYGGVVKEAGELVEKEKQANEERAKANEQTGKLISDKQFEIEQGKLVAEGKGREAAIEEAIRQAKEQNKNITAEQLAQVAELTGRLYDQQHAQDGVKLAEEEVNRLLQMRQELMQQIEYFQGQGQNAEAEALKGQLSGVNAELDKAIEKSIAMWRAIGGPEADLAIAKLNSTKLSLVDMGTKSQITGKQINDMLTSGLLNALDSFAQAVANGENAVDALWRAFRQFAAEFLINIAKMILQQAIFNLLSGGVAGGGGGIGGAIAGFIGKLFHEGGVVGSGGGERMMSPAWFTDAYAYHGGGIAGLQPGEVPALLMEGEEVLTEDNPRHIANGGGAQRPVIKIVNAFDSAQVVSEGLASPVGEEVLMNFVRSNASGIRSVLGA